MTDEPKAHTFKAGFSTVSHSHLWAAAPPGPFRHTRRVGHRVDGVRYVKFSDELLLVDHRELRITPAYSEPGCYCDCPNCDVPWIDVPERREWVSVGTTSYREVFPNFDVPRDNGVRENPDGSWTITRTVTLT